jgi:HlyD family type I secretion membrane fusion protein
MPKNKTPQTGKTKANDLLAIPAKRVKKENTKKPDGLLAKPAVVEKVNAKKAPALKFQKKSSDNLRIFSDKYKPVVSEKLKVCRQILKSYIKLLFGKSEFAQSNDVHVNEVIAEKRKEVRQAIDVSLKAAVRVITVMVVLFVVWGGFAPLESSVIASGFVTVETNRKTVQHLEGGIISEILVKEGDTVVKGQQLLYLNSTSANAQQQLIMGQYIGALANEGRLIAERDGEAAIQFSNELYDYYDQTKIIDLTDAQTKMFENRKNSLQGKIDILDDKIRQYKKQIGSLEVQVKEIVKQTGIVADQVKTSQALFDKGYGQKSKLLEFKNRYSELKGREAELEAQIATTNGSISEAKLQIINEKNNFLKDVMDELKDVQQKISGFREQLQASKDVLERTVITAPQSGKVTGLRQHTIGGVISPGAPLMDIIPQNDKLHIEARVQLQDIDVVHEGLESRVLLSAYRSRVSPRLAGTIKYVSADKFTDDKSGVQYYLAHVEINENSLKKLGSEITLYPGMPAEVFITTGSTTFLKYLLRPLMDSFYRSVRD